VIRALRIGGVLAGLSTAFWLGTGMGWWSPTPEGLFPMREAVLFLIHTVVIFAAVMSYV
jgi:hypothetical protein